MSYTPRGKRRLPAADLPWEDLRVEFNSGISPASNPPQRVAYKGGLVSAFEDEGVNEDTVTFQVQLPHNYAEGTDIEPHIHWAGEDNTAGNVKWIFTYSWANIGAAFPGETSDTAIGANPATDVHTLTEFTQINGAGKTVSSVMICRLSRNSTDGDDTFTAKDAYGLYFDFHYQIDSMGSDLDDQKDI